MLEELERLREKALNKIIICSIVVIFCAIILGILTKPFFGPFAIVIGILITYLITNKDIKNFKDYYKTNIVVVTMKSIFEDISFDLNKGLPYKVLADTKMIYMGDRYSSNDYFKGKYKNIAFEMSDVEIEEEHTDSEGHTSYTTIFKGQWYIFEFNKYFKSNMQVCDRRFHIAKRNFMKKVEMEDIDFNKKFRILANSEMEAFYVLTPNMMERIKQLRETTQGRFVLCFIDNKLHIGLNNNKDFFEASIFRKVNFEEAVNKVKKEMSVITNFIDVLNLDNDLFKINGGGMF